MYGIVDLSNNLNTYSNVTFNSNIGDTVTFTNNLESIFNHNVTFNSNVTISSINGGLFTAENI